MQHGSNIWRSSWTASKAELEKQAEARALDRWQQPVQRLDESVETEAFDELPHAKQYERPQRNRPRNRSHPRWDDEQYDEEPWPPSPEAKMQRFFLWRWLSKFIPKGYGTYAAVAAWIVINIFAALGYQIPGFDVIEGNEGAGINLGLALAYLRRALD